MMRSLTNLQQRVLSGAIMGAVAIACVVAGGEFFFMMTALLCIACCYEAWRFRLRPPALAWGTMVYILWAFAAAYQFYTEAGWIAFASLGAVVIATDVGAYAAGRIVGGAKMAPRISPGKTWAGAVGGVVFAVAVSCFLSQDNIVMAAVFGLVMSIAAQAGDLFESFLKRRAGVKDSSSMIPGHGGFFDRLDSWIAVFLVNGLWQVGQTFL